MKQENRKIKITHFINLYLFRALLTGALALIQLGLILACFCCAYYAFIIFRYVLFFTALFTALKIASYPEHYPTKTGWIIGILALPVIFLPLYFLFGRGKIIRKIKEYTKDHHLTAEGCINIKDKIPAKYAMQFSAVAKKGGFGIYDNTACKYLSDGMDILIKLRNMLESAEKYIFIEFFIIAKGAMWGEVLEILKRKAAEGVKIYILIDDIGTICLLPYKYPKKLKSFGIECRRHNSFAPKITPAVNYRDHRKIVVCDGKTALTCGANIADEYINRISPYGYWKDTGAFFEGQAAESFADMFIQMWNLSGGDLKAEDHITPYKNNQNNNNEFGVCMPFGDYPTRSIGYSETVFLNMINSAEESIYITTPYLVPDENIASALWRAAERGIDVRIITPLTPDKRFVHTITRQNYIPMIEKGIKVYEYDPGFIHAKNILCDGKFAYVGSANLDLRSLYLHFECGVLMYKCEACEQLKKDFDELFTLSHLMKDTDEVLIQAKKSFIGRIMRLIAPLL